MLIRKNLRTFAQNLRRKQMLGKGSLSLQHEI